MYITNLIQVTARLFVDCKDCKLYLPFHLGRTILHQRQHTDTERQGQNFVTLLQRCFKLCSSVVKFYVVTGGYILVLYIYSLIKCVNGMRWLNETINKSFIHYLDPRKIFTRLIYKKNTTVYKHRKIVREKIGLGGNLLDNSNNKVILKTFRSPSLGDWSWIISFHFPL